MVASNQKTHHIHIKKQNITVNKPRKFFSASYLFLILIASMIIVWHIKPATASTITVGPPPGNYDYNTIQAAVNNAVSGDRITVAPATYYERVTIPDLDRFNNALTNIEIVGNVANPATTIVDGNGGGPVFSIQASKVTIKGFTIRNAGNSQSAIRSQRATPTNDYHNITNNIIQTSKYGVDLGASNSNTVSYNTFFDNAFSGIILNDADNNNIIGNTITESLKGIETAASNNNIIIDNIISKTSYCIYVSSTSQGNTITHNTLSARSAAIYVDTVTTSNTFDHNTITESDFGFYIYNSKNANAYYNIITNSSRGIRLYGPSVTNEGHNIQNNKLVNVDYALELVYADGNTFTGNWAQENTYGIYLSASSSNTFYRNNFQNNTMQVYAGSTGNTWDKFGEGNHWSDYTGPDNNNNGIGDTPYIIANPTDKDNYPLMRTWSEHDISVETVTTSTSIAYVGSTINITVTVKNNANTTVSESFTVTAKYNSTIIGTQTVTNLAQGATQALTFNWDTIGTAAGNYTISATASTVTDELNTDNNNKIDGITRILIPGDINRDNKVDLTDLKLLNQAYGSTLGQLNWNPNADLNKDNIINLLDLFILSKNYGKSS